MLPCAVYAAVGGATTQTAAAGTTTTTASVGGSTYGSAPATKPAKTSPTARKLRVRAKPALNLGDRIPLRRGMRGRDVKMLQDFLDRLGIDVAVDGSFGKGTYRAVRRFQKRVAMPVDGVLRAEGVNRLREVLEQGSFDLVTVPASTAADGAVGPTAVINPDGTATPPAGAPPAVASIIAAGNKIATKPYKYGGGHGSFEDSGYDCSGTVSYALRGANLLTTPRDSSGFESFGLAGPGQWVTIYAKASHVYMVVAGIRFDTSGRSKAGTRWQAEMRPPTGYVVRHPVGL